jgi:conjugative transposon protein TcpC
VLTSGGVSERSSASLAGATRIATWALWSLVILGAVAGVSAHFARQPRASELTRSAPSSSLEAEGFAQLYVAAYLSAGEGTEDQLRKFYPAVPSLQGTHPGSFYAARTATMGARPLGRNYWSVTVAADVLRPEGGGFRPVGNRFYSVGVALTPKGGLVATSLPAEVPRPPEAKVPKLALGSLEPVVADDPVAQAVGHFASAFLTGDGELDRYVSPASALRPVQPPPFTAVEVTRLAQRSIAGPDQAVAILAEVRAVDGTKRAQVLHYALELARREGRWEVRSLLPAVPLAKARDSGLATSPLKMTQPS